MRAMLHFLLQDAGCHVAEVAGPIADPALLCADAPTLIACVAGRHDDTLQLISRVRRQCPSARLLVFGRGITIDLRRRALALGAHYVIGLPIATHDLQRRLHEALGDAAPATASAAPTHVRAGGFILYPHAQAITDEHGWTAPLTRHEVALLAALMVRPGHPVGQAQLAETIWPDGACNAHNALAQLVRRLRAKLAARAGAPAYLRTVRGHGYVFEARATPRAHDAVVPGADRPILVIDDDEATMSCVGEVLGCAGYTVAQGSGAQAPALARQTHPRLVLLDIHMPGMNGVEVCQQLRAHPRTAGIPIIAFSAGYNLRANLSRMAADDWLSKPFDADELLMRIQKWGGAASYAGLA